MGLKTKILAFMEAILRDRAYSIGIELENIINE